MSYGNTPPEDAGGEGRYEGTSKMGKSLKVLFVPALLICILYAASDEIHQIFVPGKGAHVKDVFIDSAESIVGILAYMVFDGHITRKLLLYN
jgi:VanZ family protein